MLNFIIMQSPWQWRHQFTTKCFITMLFLSPKAQHFFANQGHWCNYPLERTINFSATQPQSRNIRIDWVDLKQQLLQGYKETWVTICFPRKVECHSKTYKPHRDMWVKASSGVVCAGPAVFIFVKQDFSLFSFSCLFIYWEE